MKMREANSLTDAELAEVLDFADVVSGWIKSVRSEAFKRANARTGCIPGYKLVPGSSSRDFLQPEAVPDALVKLGVPADKLYSQALVSVAQAEALLKGIYKGRGHKKIFDEFAKLYRKTSGTTSLARDSDGREEVRRGHEFKDKFGNVAKPDNIEKVEDLL